jgi:hypothetical protein
MLVAESNFQGDEHQRQYEEVALRMARSIRLVSKN